MCNGVISIRGLPVTLCFMVGRPWSGQFVPSLSNEERIDLIDTDC